MRSLHRKACPECGPPRKWRSLACQSCICPCCGLPRPLMTIPNELLVQTEGQWQIMVAEQKDSYNEKNVPDGRTKGGWENVPMTNDCATLLLTMILKFRKQTAILATSRRQEAKCIFGGGRLGGSGLVCGLFYSCSCAWLWLFSQRKLGHNEIDSR